MFMIRLYFSKYSPVINSMKTIFFILILALLVSCSDNDDRNEVSDKEQHLPNHKKLIKAAHYFSDAWPKTFWQEFEASKVDRDLQQIKQDGFNTVILVLPWVGFELSFQNPQTISNPKMYHRLQFLLDRIKFNKLDYMLRLGFPHDYSPKTNTSIVEVCTNMYEDPQQKNKWKDYLNKIKNITDKSPENLVGILVSWEDFWCPHFVFPHLDEARRLQLAEKTGYAEWLLQRDEMTLKVVMGNNTIKKELIAIPKKTDMAYFYYIEFIDKKFEELVLKPTQSIFLQTAMEIRIDKDPVKSATGENIWVGHKLYFDEKNHRGTYWAPFWGANNQGEKLPLKQALFNFEYFLNYVTDNGKSTNHVIEQFNFTDNTPYFPNHASLNESEVAEFLSKSAPLLKKYSNGYGVWAYRDYVDNSLYNSSFEVGLDGWVTQGEVKLIKGNRDNQIKLSKDSSISQSYNPHTRHMLATSYQQLNFCFVSENTGNIDIYSSSDLVANIAVETGTNCIKFQAEKLVTAKQVELRIVANNDLVLDELKLYGFVQKLGMYDEFNSPASHLKAIKQLNVKLQ